MAITGAVPAVADGTATNCKCRFFGDYFKLGAVVCMRTSTGMKLARCTMNQNNTSWKILDAPCPVSRAPQMAPVIGQLASQRG